MLRRGRASAALVLLILCVACTEPDEAIFRDVAVARLLIVDPGLTRQSFDANSNPQVAEFEVLEAVLRLGDRDIDLRFDQSCDVVDTISTVPTADGSCAVGVVLDATAEAPMTAELSIAYTARLRRAEPRLLSLAPGADDDGDGIPSDGDNSGSAFDRPCAPGQSVGCDDNCPLTPNPDQADEGANGFGDACSFPDGLGGVFLDSDGDGVIDLLDNCIGVPNPNQENTTGIPGDTIGDACVEQQAVSHLEGNPRFELTSQLALAPTPQQLTYIVVDMNSRRITCNWEFGVCSTAPPVRVCLASSLGVATLGCAAP